MPAPRPVGFAQVGRSETGGLEVPGNVDQADKVSQQLAVSTSGLKYFQREMVTK
jgi:hypothetical protein